MINLLAAMLIAASLRAADPLPGGQKAGGVVRPRYIDLSHSLAEGSPVYPGGEQFKLVKLADLAQGYYLNKLSLGEHFGTHLDAPCHFAAKGKAVDQIPIQDLIGPLLVIDISAQVAKNDDYALTLEDVRRFEATHEIPVGAFVCARTGWSARWDDSRRYVNQTEATKVPHFPGVSASAAKYLVDERKILGLGIDTLSVDPGVSTDFPVHKAVLGAGRVNLENLTDLDKVPAAGATLVATPLKIAGGSGSPVRAFAILPSR